jgi:hypothetical protein
MMRTKSFGWSAAALTMVSVLALAGCDGGTGPDEASLTSEDADAIAGFMFSVDALAVGIADLASSTGTRSFTRTAPCPAGGSVSVSGSGESSTNQDTHVVSTKWSNTQAHAACAISKTRGDKTMTAVMDGSVTTSGTSSFKLPESRGAERTLLTWSSTTVGSTTTKVGDRSNTCAVDVKQTYDAGTKIFTLTGVVCGRQVNTTRGLGG